MLYFNLSLSNQSLYERCTIADQRRLNTIKKMQDLKAQTELKLCTFYPKISQYRSLSVPKQHYAVPTKTR